MMQRIQTMNQAQRVLLFFMFFGGGLMAIIALTVFFIYSSINSGQRQVIQAIQSEPLYLPLGADGEREAITVSVEEAVLLDDKSAHPSALALADDGTLYIGSYGMGAVWMLSPDDETLTELPDTRDQIGSVTGLALGPDGALYVLDRLDPDPKQVGGTLWRIAANGALEDLGEIGALGFESPGHVAVDADGMVYVTDLGRGEIWRYDLSGETQRLWQAPEDLPRGADMVITGIAYDPTTDSLIVTDSGDNEGLSTVLRVSLDGAETDVLYNYAGPVDDTPNFTGVDVSANGRIVLAAGGNRRVGMLLDGDLFYLAENLRQVSDVAVSADGNRIYAANKDARSFALSFIKPQRPFSVDLITLSPVEDGD